MIDGIIIRPARPQESDLLTGIAFRAKSHWGYSQEFMSACRDELAVSGSDIADPRRHYFVAELDGELVGFCALEWRSADEYELEALFVEPHRIGTGVGRTLMTHARSAARDLGARSLLIQGDPHAAAFYIAAGAVRVGERESDSIPGRYLPEFRMALV